MASEYLQANAQQMQYLNNPKDVQSDQKQNMVGQNPFQTPQAQLFATYFQNRHDQNGHLYTADQDGLSITQRQELNNYEGRRIREQDMRNNGVGEADIALFRKWDEDLHEANMTGKALDFNKMFSAEYSQSATEEYNYNETMYSTYVSNARLFAKEQYDPEGTGHYNLTKDMIDEFKDYNDEELANVYDNMTQDGHKFLNFDGVHDRTEFVKRTRGIIDAYHNAHSGFLYNLGQFFKAIPSGFISAIMEIPKIATTVVSLGSALFSGSFDNPVSRAMASWNKTIDENTSEAYNRAVGVDKDSIGGKIGGFVGQAAEMAAEVALTAGASLAIKGAEKLALRAGEGMAEKATARIAEKETALAAAKAAEATAKKAAEEAAAKGGEEAAARAAEHETAQATTKSAQAALDSANKAAGRAGFVVQRYSGKLIEREAIKMAQKAGTKVTEDMLMQAARKVGGEVTSEAGLKALEHGITGATVRLAKRGVYTVDKKAIEELGAKEFERASEKAAQGALKKAGAKTTKEVEMKAAEEAATKTTEKIATQEGKKLTEKELAEANAKAAEAQAKKLGVVGSEEKALTPLQKGANKIAKGIVGKVKLPKSIDKIIRKGAPEHLIASMAQKPGTVIGKLFRSMYGKKDPLTKLFALKSFSSSIQNSQARGGNPYASFGRALLAYGTTNMIWGKMAGAKPNAIKRMFDKNFVNKAENIVQSRILSSIIRNGAENVGVAAKMWTDGTLQDFINEGFRRGDDGKLHAGFSEIFKRHANIASISETFLSAFTMHVTGGVWSKTLGKVIHTTIVQPYEEKQNHYSTLMYMDEKMGDEKNGIGKEIWQSYKDMAKKSLGENAKDEDVLDLALNMAADSGGPLGNLASRLFIQAKAVGWGTRIRSNLEHITEEVQATRLEIKKKIEEKIEAFGKMHHDHDQEGNYDFQLFLENVIMGNANLWEGEEIPEDIKANVNNWTPEEMYVAWAFFKNKKIDLQDPKVDVQAAIRESFKNVEGLRKVLTPEEFSNLLTMSHESINKIAEKLQDPALAEDAKKNYKFSMEMKKAMALKKGASREKAIDRIVKKYDMTEANVNKAIGNGDVSIQPVAEEAKAAAERIKKERIDKVKTDPAQAAAEMLDRRDADDKAIDPEVTINEVKEMFKKKNIDKDQYIKMLYEISNYVNKNPQFDSFNINEENQKYKDIYIVKKLFDPLNKAKISRILKSISVTYDELTPKQTTDLETMKKEAEKIKDDISSLRVKYGEESVQEIFNMIFPDFKNVDPNSIKGLMSDLNTILKARKDTVEYERQKENEELQEANLKLVNLQIEGEKQRQMLERQKAEREAKGSSTRDLVAVENLDPETQKQVIVQKEKERKVNNEVKDIVKETVETSVEQKEKEAPKIIDVEKEEPKVTSEEKQQLEEISTETTEETKQEEQKPVEEQKPTEEQKPVEEQKQAEVESKKEKDLIDEFAKKDSMTAAKVIKKSLEELEARRTELERKAIKDPAQYAGELSEVFKQITELKKELPKLIEEWESNVDKVIKKIMKKIDWTNQNDQVKFIKLFKDAKERYGIDSYIYKKIKEEYMKSRCN